MSLHSSTLFLFRANQSLLSPSCCVLRGEATNTNFIVFGLTQPGLEPTIYRTRHEHANYNATDAVSPDRYIYILYMIISTQIGYGMVKYYRSDNLNIGKHTWTMFVFLIIRVQTLNSCTM